MHKPSNSNKRVLVIEDSGLMRRIISDILDEVPGIIVVGTAKDGKEGLKLAFELNPDIITLDVEMPGMNGIQVLETLMQHRPIPVLMLSSHTREGAEITIKALELGAIDFITKPAFLAKNLNGFKNELIDKINSFSKVQLLTVQKNTRSQRLSLKQYPKTFDTIIAIGTSTGGPSALNVLLSEFPRDTAAAFLVVQHMPPGFTKSLSERLNNVTALSVKEAESGDILEAGRVLVAPGSYHMVLEHKSREYSVKLEQASMSTVYKPSVDVLFKSLSCVTDKRLIAVILTGMGNDGVKGLLCIRNKPNLTVLAQDEESCVVFGMPRAVINKGLADKVVSLPQMGSEIIKILTCKG